MPQYFPSMPAFADDQVVSADAQLNVLGDGVNSLLGAYLAAYPVWSCYEWRDGFFANGWGVYDAADGLWTRIYTGRIRHKYNTFGYSFRVTKDASYKVDIRMQVGDTSDIIDQSDDANLRVAAGAGTVTVTGSVDISGHSLTVNTFYTCTIDVRLLDGSNNPVAGVASAVVIPVYLREVSAGGYSALASFAVASTPTSAQWQALSTRATNLHSQLSTPRPGFISRTGTATRFWQGSLHYVNPLLYYDLRLRSPYWQKDPYASTPVDLNGDGTPDTNQPVGLRFGDWFALVYVNDTQVLAVGYGVLAAAIAAGDTTITLMDDAYFAAGDYVVIDSEVILLGTKSGNTWTSCTRAQFGTTAAAHSIYAKVRTWSAYDKTAQAEQWYNVYRGTVDLSSLSLTEGTVYRVRVDTYYYDHSPDGGGDGDRRLILYMLQNQPDYDPYLSGWTAVPTFAHGDSVDGDVTTLRDDLTWLTTRAENAYNYPTHKVQRDHNQYRNTYLETWFYRYHRWLHYRIEPPAETTYSPTLAYWHKGAWQKVSLDNRPNEWLRLDLDSVPGLLEGVRYQLSDVTFSLEDDDA